MVLRGTAFRQGATNGTECRHDERQRQLAAVELLLKNLVEPLERLCDANVEIFAPAVANPRVNIADCEELHEDLGKAFNRRIVTTNVTKTRGQAESMRFAMNLFKSQKLRPSVEDCKCETRTLIFRFVLRRPTNRLPLTIQKQMHL